MHHAFFFFKHLKLLLFFGEKKLHLYAQRKTLPLLIRGTTQKLITLIISGSHCI